jgi:hypothetical protein
MRQGRIPESKIFDELKEFFSEKYICCAARSCFQYSSVYFFKASTLWLQPSLSAFGFTQ